jgi:hypothetical protein
VHDQFRWFSLDRKINADLPGPEAFAAATRFVRGEDVAASVPCGSDVDQHVAAFPEVVDAGFPHAALVQVGGTSQPASRTGPDRNRCHDSGSCDASRSREAVTRPGKL